MAPRRDPLDSAGLLELLKVALVLALVLALLALVLEVFCFLVLLVVLALVFLLLDLDLVLVLAAELDLSADTHVGPVILFLFVLVVVATNRNTTAIAPRRLVDTICNGMMLRFDSIRLLSFRVLSVVGSSCIVLAKRNAHGNEKETHTQVESNRIALHHTLLIDDVPLSETVL
jgi:hypothetical protein